MYILETQYYHLDKEKIKHHHFVLYKEEDPIVDVSVLYQEKEEKILSES